MKTIEININITFLIILLISLLFIFLSLILYFNKSERTKWIVIKIENEDKVIYLHSILQNLAKWNKRNNDENLYFFIMEKVDSFLYPEKAKTLEYQKREDVNYSIKDVENYLRTIKENKNKQEIKSFLYGLEQFKPYLKKEETKDLVQKIKKELEE